MIFAAECCMQVKSVNFTTSGMKFTQSCRFSRMKTIRQLTDPKSTNTQLWVLQVAICPYRLTPVNFTIPPSHIQAISDALESIKRWLLITARPKVEDCRPFDGFHDFTTHSWHVVLMQTNGAIWSVCGLNSQTVEFMSTRSTVIPLPGSLSLYTSLTGLRNVKGTLRASESLVLVPHTTRFSGFQSSHSSVFWSQ